MCNLYSWVAIRSGIAVVRAESVVFAFVVVKRATSSNCDDFVFTCIKLGTRFSLARGRARERRRELVVEVGFEDTRIESREMKLKEGRRASGR